MTLKFFNPKKVCCHFNLWAGDVYQNIDQRDSRKVDARVENHRYLLKEPTPHLVDCPAQSYMKNTSGKSATLAITGSALELIAIFTVVNNKKAEQLK